MHWQQGTRKWNQIERRPVDWMPTDKLTELSRNKLKTLMQYLCSASIQRTHKYHNTPVPYPIMHDFVTEMCMCEFFGQSLCHGTNVLDSWHLSMLPQFERCDKFNPHMVHDFSGLLWVNFSGFIHYINDFCGLYACLWLGISQSIRMKATNSYRFIHYINDDRPIYMS